MRCTGAAHERRTASATPPSACGPATPWSSSRAASMSARVDGRVLGHGRSSSSRVRPGRRSRPRPRRLTGRSWSRSSGSGGGSSGGPPRVSIVLLERLLGIVPDVGGVGEVLHDGVDRRRERYGDQGAGDAGDEDADADRDDHAERVHRHEPAHQERLQHVALDLLHEDHAAQHQERHDRALVDQRDQDGDGAGDGGADHRHERAEEDQHADRQHERHAEDRAPRSSCRSRRWRPRSRWPARTGSARPRRPGRSCRPARGRRAGTSRTSQAQIRSPSARKK